MRWIPLAALVAACNPPPAPAPSTPAPAPLVPAAPDARAEVDAAPAPDAGPAPLAVVHAFAGIDVVESHNEARHVHGGAPASVGDLSINLEVRDGRAHTIVVRSATLLRASCREATWRDRTPLRLTEVAMFTWDDAAPVAIATGPITIPAGPPRRWSIGQRFAPVAAYQACDRFGFAVELEVDGARAALELPLDVVRFEPLRRP